MGQTITTDLSNILKREFGNNFNVCMNRIANQDGSRFADWCLDAWIDMGQTFRENRYSSF